MKIFDFRCAISAAAGVALLASYSPSDAASIAGDLSYDGPTGQSGRPGNMALSLDGDGDFVRTPLRNLSGSEITIGFWFKGSVAQSVVRQQATNGVAWVIAGWFGQHILSNDGQTDGIEAGDDITDGDWHHVAFSWKQGTIDGWVAYVDGEVTNTKNTTNIAIPNHAIETYFGAANGAGEFADGLIDDIAIWNRALEQSEIRAAMDAPLQGDEAGLTGYWNFDDGTANDLTAAANHGALNGDATIVEAEDIGGAGQFVVEASPKSPANSVLCLDGVDDTVAIDTLTDMSGSEITISYWFKGDGHRSIVRQQRSSGFFWIVGGWNTQHILSNDGRTSGVSVGDGINDGTWHHVVMSWKQGTLDGFASYLDGQPVESRDSANAPLPNNGVPFYFGSVNAAAEFGRGCIDEIAIWRRSFTAEEIATSWNQRLTGDEEGLAGYWTFDDATADDSTTNGHHGRLLGGAQIMPDSIPNLDGVLVRQTLSSAGPFLLEGAIQGVEYCVDAYYDLNGNDMLDPGEWCGQFPGSPFRLAGDATEVDINLYDPSTMWLRIEPSGGSGDLVLSWPEFATGTTLRSSTDLTSAPWEEVPGEISTADGVHSLTLTPLVERQFFRLEKR